jgi:hypothetical protein
MGTETEKLRNKLTVVEDFSGVEDIMERGYQRYESDEFVIWKVEEKPEGIASFDTKRITSVLGKENPVIDEGKGSRQGSRRIFDPGEFTFLIYRGGQFGEVRCEIHPNVGLIKEEGTQNIEMVQEELSKTTGNRIINEVLYAAWNELRQEALNVFLVGEEEDFEDGMVSDFSVRLCRLLEKYGKATINEIDHLIDQRNISDGVLGEALRCLGRLDNAETHEYRLWLLQKSLSCSSVYLRDSAAIGIGSMNDVSAIDSLEKAVEQEKNKELKEDMAEVLRELKGEG